MSISVAWTLKYKTENGKKFTRKEKNEEIIGRHQELSHLSEQLTVKGYQCEVDEVVWLSNTHSHTCLPT